MDTAAQVKQILRERWPESGGQVAHQQAVRAQDAVTERILALLRCECCHGRCSCGGQRIFSIEE